MTATTHSIFRLHRSDNSFAGLLLRRAVLTALPFLLMVTSCKTEPDPPATAPEENPPAQSGSDTNVADVPEAPSTDTPGSDTTETQEKCKAIESRIGDASKRDTQKREPKIVGGKPTKEDTFKFAVALAFESSGSLRQYCGGSVVGKNWVLTAAHCQVLPGEKAIVGRRDLTTADGQIVNVKRVLNHADYDSGTNDNDIALLQLDKDVQVEPVKPYAGDSDLSSETSIVVGWGRIQEGGPASGELQEVTVPVVTNTVCNEGYSTDGVNITQNMLCAGLGQGGKDSCQGDSGGPLMVSVGGKLQQAGVVSFGIGCARPQKYGVYTRVSRYAGWIDACMKTE